MSKSRLEIFVAGAVRTPIGRFGGGLAALSAADLGTRAAAAALERSGLAPPTRPRSGRFTTSSRPTSRPTPTTRASP